MKTSAVIFCLLSIIYSIPSLGQQAQESSRIHQVPQGNIDLAKMEKYMEWATNNFVFGENQIQITKIRLSYNPMVHVSAVVTAAAPALFGRVDEYTLIFQARNEDGTHSVKCNLALWEREKIANVINCSSRTATYWRSLGLPIPYAAIGLN